MNAIDLIRIHLELECLATAPDGLLHTLPCADAVSAPRFYAALHPGGCVRYYRGDLPTPLRYRLESLSPTTALQDHARVKAILGDHQPCETVWHGMSYVFPVRISEGQFPDAVRLTEQHRPLIDLYHPEMVVEGRTVYGVIVDNRLVSTCESSRENRVAGEAWVQTRAEYRGRGYAAQATFGWARDLRAQGKIPFYSHRVDNPASQRVAETMALLRYITDASYG